jgi:hypothetical protein
LTPSIRILSPTVSFFEDAYEAASSTSLDGLLVNQVPFTSCALVMRPVVEFEVSTPATV